MGLIAPGWWRSHLALACQDDKLARVNLTLPEEAELAAPDFTLIKLICKSIYLRKLSLARPSGLCAF